MKTVKVRIAVAVDPTGNWNSCGFKSDGDLDKMEIAIDSVKEGENRYWLEAELEVPDKLKGEVIQAEVTKDE